MNANSAPARPTLPAHLTRLRVASGLSYEAIARRAGDERKHMHRLFNGEQKPRRDTLIRLALALNLDVQATDELLRIAGFPGLLSSPASKV